MRGPLSKAKYYTKKSFMITDILFQAGVLKQMHGGFMKVFLKTEVKIGATKFLKKNVRSVDSEAVYLLSCNYGND